MNDNVNYWLGVGYSVEKNFEAELRADFDDLLDTVMNQFQKKSNLTYEEEFERWIIGESFSWL